MNKTISINLSGAIFNIEEDAFNHLKSYLDRIKQMFAGDPGEAEIMADIESRIAELFTENLGDKKSVILQQDVERIIQIMGQPEDYAPEDKRESHASGGEETESKEPIRNKNRRVFRDTEDSIVGGVCSGLSHYLGWDPVILRILFVIFLFVGGSAILIYVIFWAVMPAADTTAEKLQMRGEPVTVENIRKFVNEEAQNAGENIKSFAKRTRSSDFFRTFGFVLKRLVGAFLILIGTGLMIGMVTAWVVADINLFGSGTLSYDLMSKLVFNDDSSLTLLIIGASLVLVIPAIAMVYAGFRMVFDFQKRIPGVGISLLLLFMIGIAVCAIGGVRTGRQFAYDADAKTEVLPDPITADTLVVNVSDDPYFDKFIKNSHREMWQMIRMENDSTIYGAPVHLEFYDQENETENKEFSISVIRESNGPSRQEAYRLADNIRYNYSMNGNILTLDPVFKTSKNDLYRGQEVTIRVYVPHGKSVQFGSNIGRINWHDDFEGRTMKMTEEGWVNASSSK